jgi:hypothetical protein
MDWNKIPHYPRHLGVLSGAFKMIFEPMVCSAQIVHVLCIKIRTIYKQTEMISTWALSPRSTIRCIQNDFYAYGMFGANRGPIWLQDCQHLQTKWNKILHDTGHLVVPSCASKMISQAVVRSAQTVHLSWTDTNTISYRTEMRFHINHIT